MTEKPTGQSEHEKQPLPSAEGLAENLEHLINQAQDLGMFTRDHIPSQAERTLTSEIRKFLPSVQTALEKGSARHIILLHHLYDLAFRLSHKQIPSCDQFPRLFTRAITLWLQGDKSISEEDLIAMLQQIDPRHIEFKYIDWSSSVLNQWINELEYNAGTFHNIDPTKAYQRLTILLRADLWAYFTSRETDVKQSWITANLINNTTDLPSAALPAYQNFLSASTRFLPER